MKKILMMALALCLLCGGAALADTNNNEETMSPEKTTATTTLSYTIDANESYTVTIPSSVGLSLNDSNNKLSGSLEVKLDASSFNVEGKTISVKMSQNSGALMRQDGGTIPFNVYKDTIAEGNEVQGAEANRTFISWTFGQAGSANISQTLLIGTGDISTCPAGDYKGLVMFAVSVTDATNSENQ